MLGGGLSSFRGLPAFLLATQPLSCGLSNSGTKMGAVCKAIKIVISKRRALVTRFGAVS